MSKISQPTEKPKSCRAAVSSFLRNTAGSIAPMTGLMAIPLLFAAGAAIDMGRYASEQVSFPSVVDSAALTIANDDRAALDQITDTNQRELKRQELEDFAEEIINKNHAGRTSVDGGRIQATLEVTGTQVRLEATLDVPMTIMQLANVEKFQIKARSQVMKAGRPIELAMVMDTTGSMASSGKITAAKAAARTLLDKLYEGNLASKPRSQNIRLALVPFAAGVRLNTAHADFNPNWIDTTGLNPLSRINFDLSGAPATLNNFTAWATLKKSTTAYQTWNGCVEARMRGSSALNTDYNVNDIPPSTTNPATLFPAYFAPDSPSNWGYNYITGTSTTAVGSECKGLTSTQCSSTATANMYLKQENYRKYQDKNIGVESVSTDGPWSGCAASAIVPMTYDRQTIDNGITAMTADGPTLIAEGLAWGLRVISPTEPFTQVQGSGTLPATTIAPLNDVRWKKIVVLMTDGDNDLGAGSYSSNNTIYSSYGYGGEVLASNRIGTTASSATMTALDNEMLAACSRVKSTGALLYVVSFGSGVSTTTRTRLQNCATEATYYSHAATSADLTAVFNSIGSDVLAKTIYVAK